MTKVVFKVVLPPIYCKDCKRSNSWTRLPQKDILTESGKPFEYAYQCKCGRMAFIPANGGNNNG